MQQRAVRVAALRTFRHLHALSPALIWIARPAHWHVRSIAAPPVSVCLRLAVFNVVPTLIELLLVTTIIGTCSTGGSPR